MALSQHGMRLCIMMWRLLSFIFMQWFKISSIVRMAVLIENLFGKQKKTEPHLSSIHQAPISINLRSFCFACYFNFVFYFYGSILFSYKYEIQYSFVLLNSFDDLNLIHLATKSVRYHTVHRNTRTFVLKYFRKYQILRCLIWIHIY